LNLEPLGDALQPSGAIDGVHQEFIAHSVAALLNAKSGDVNYAYTEAQVIQMVQDALSNPGTILTTKDLFVTQNEAGCPLN
jgi:hypothetical protein